MDLRDDVVRLVRAGLFVVCCNTVLTQVNAWDHSNQWRPNSFCNYGWNALSRI